MNSKIGAARIIVSPFLQMNIEIWFFFEQFTWSNNIQISKFLDYEFFETTLLILLVCMLLKFINCKNLETLFLYYNKIHKN